MPSPREIPLDEATAIIEAHQGGPMTRVVVAFAGKWYDVRECSEEEFQAFIQSLVGDKAVEIKHVDVEI